jgi:prepilin signal peptidase PulO-like enzyme (type II secretory pathway)
LVPVVPRATPSARLRCAILRVAHQPHRFSCRVPVAAIYAWSGANPLVGTELIPAVAAAVAIPAVLYLPSIPFGAGAFGIGDVKLLAGVGLMAGGAAALGSVVFALALSGVVIVVLLATRRIGRRTYIPFGPFFIIGALWAVLIRN